jgi:hypothetical protein
MILTLEVSHEVLRAIAWLKDRPLTYRYQERSQRLETVEKFLGEVLVAAVTQTPKAQ